MEIRKSRGRFLSILFIVTLGVAFFSGIRASEPDMRLTGDAYFDEAELMDIKAICTYGVTEDDVEAMEAEEGVACAEGAYSADFLYSTKDAQQVLHVMSLQEKMNQITVSKGRMPESAGECLADDNSSFAVGDQIRLESGTEDEVTDTLKTDTLEVVGLGNSPCYLSYGRGSSTVGDGSIRAFLIVPEDTFDMEVYSEVYMQVTGAKELLAFTDAYDGRVEEVLKRIEALADDRAVVRKDSLKDEANEKLEEAREELEDGRKEAKKKLDNAAKEIADAEKKLADARKQIEDGRAQIADAKMTLSSKQKELDAARVQYQDGVAQLNDGKAAYEEGLLQYEEARAEADVQLQTGRQLLDGLQAQINADEERYYALLAQIEDLREQADVSEDSLDDTGESAGEPDTGPDQQIAALEAQAQAVAARLEGERQAYTLGQAGIEVVHREMDSVQAELTAAKSQIDAAEAELAAAPAKLSSGQAQINSGWNELRSQEQKLVDGEAEIVSNEAKLVDAKKEYEEGKAEAEAEIADGEKKIAEAEADIEDIELPKWYVYDRSTLIEYSGFGENAQRLGAIGRVFPVLFFLVAALISLTSMTRMVEEQRTSIGTMKALGYSKGAIASKYIEYALLATAGGSVIGVLIGEKILPYIIVYAYGILYQHLPKILVPYDWGYAAMASGAAVFCTLFATVMACYKELEAQPAVLMRPPAPKNGRRVFLERIGVVWRHLNFTWKSTIRNLMRYKKRFFMTIFGIGGCMALMLVGFGLKDSCYEIAKLQFAEIQFYDGSIYLEEDITEEQQDELEAALKSEEQISRYMKANMQNITLVNGKKECAAYECVFGSVEDIPWFVDFHDRRSKERYELTDDGGIISEKTAKLLDVKQGDTIEIKDEEKGNKQVKVTQICENYMGHYIYFTPACYEEVYGEEPEYNSILFEVEDSDVNADLEKIGRNLLKQDGALSVSYTHDIEKQLDDMLRSLNLVIVVLIISAGMLAFVVLYNLNTVNIAERKRELATLKVLGFYNMEVAEYVYRENILLTFLGAVVGAVLGRFLHLFIIETVEVDSAMFGRNINMPSYIYSLILTVTFSMLINGVMYFKLKKIDMVESLKSIE
ncbi:FtsX-like permease family protein [Sporofaciens sp. JLR.KK001]|uniref:FtsX-like permease family protein n=1 Tax=Sporofaciens sp. JLR.KK001 TaxID=3112621 RepID=UPI002FF1E847